MNVIVKDMKMPDCCGECELNDSDDDGIYCTALEVFMRFDELPKGRRSDCPLEEVKHEECVYIITKGKAGYHEEYKCSACGDSFYWTQDRFFQRSFNYCRNCGAKVVGFVEDMSGSEREDEANNND